MKILFVAVGRPRARWAQGALEHYRQFLAKYAKAEWRWVRQASPASLNVEEIRRVESTRVLAAVADLPGFKVVCDVQGEQLDSQLFAQRWQVETQRRGGRAIVVVGGAWGLDQRLRGWADMVWSFGPLTYPHELALVIASEQIARALSILRGDRYHK